MKRWTSNRVKLAGIITKIDGYVLHIEGHNRSIEVDIQYLRKHQPYEGGYFIMYEDDGYQSFCPEDVFERNHQEADLYTASETQTEVTVVEPPVLTREVESVLERDHAKERLALVPEEGAQDEG